LIPKPQLSIRIVSTIYKICPASAWREANGRASIAAALTTRATAYSFFHRPQVMETARKHFFGQKALFLVEVDADALGPALRWERSRNDELFPHLYGELDLGAVRAVLQMHARSDGYHDIPELKL